MEKADVIRLINIKINKLLRQQEVAKNNHNLLKLMVIEETLINLKELIGDIQDKL